MERPNDAIYSKLGDESSLSFVCGNVGVLIIRQDASTGSYSLHICMAKKLYFIMPIINLVRL